MTTDNRDKFIYLAGRYGQLVKFYNVEELCADKVNNIKNFLQGSSSVYNIGAFLRLLVSQLLPIDIEKIIYLDSDIIVNLDINELWQIDLGDKVLAAIPEILNRPDVQEDFPLCRDGIVKKEDYFNSGILPMNLKLFRNEKNIIPNWLKILKKNPRYGAFADQGTLNYYFSTRTLKLPLKFNRFVAWARRQNEFDLDKKIYHFAGRVFGMSMDDPFNRLWMRYFMKTPWFDEEAIGRLYKSFQQVHVGLKQSMINISAMMSGKTRAFFTAPNNRDAVKQIFSIHDNEEIILVDNQDALKRLIDAMNSSRGEKVFFIILPNFPFQVLTQAGFIYGKDFLNGFEFLSEAQGLPMNSYPLIQAM